MSSELSHGLAKRGPRIRKGGARKGGGSKVAVTSKAQMAAKGPVGNLVNNNFIKNPDFHDDTRYPGAGGRVEDWAGFNIVMPTYFPLTYSTAAQGSIRIRGFVTDITENFIVRFTLQDQPYPNTTKTLTKDIIYDVSNPDDTIPSPHYKSVAVGGSEISTALGVSSVDFNSVTFTILNADGTPKPSVATGNGPALNIFQIDFFQSNGTNKEAEGYESYGGAQIESKEYLGGTPYIKLTIPDDSTYGHPNVKASVNGGVGSTWKGNAMPIHWQHYCPLYVSGSTADYDTFFGKKFLRSRRMDSSFDYSDIASEHDATTISGGEYNLGIKQKKILEIFGSRGYITDRAEDVDKSYPDIPTWGCTLGSISSSDNLVNVDAFVKHSMCQSVKIPDGAVSAKYGAYVQVPENPNRGGLTDPKPAFGNSFAAIQISQDYGEGEGAVPSATNTRFVYGDSIRIANLGSSHQRPSQTLGTTTLSFTQYNWNGLATIHDASADSPTIESGINNSVPVHPHGFRYPTAIYTRGVEYSETDYREFKLVERTWKRGDQSGFAESGWRQASDLDNSDVHYNTYLKQIPYLQLELIFYEHNIEVDTINPETTGTQPEGDKVRFYAPFVIFYDSNGDEIVPS